MKITLAFDGGSRPGTGAGFGSYAVIKGNQCTVTCLEFGSGMTNHEAGYDTLIMALKTLARQEKTSDVVLEIQTPNPIIARQVAGSWQARDSRMQARRDQVASLLKQFSAYIMVHAPRESTARLLKR
jgi:ribonuclease HI